MTNHADTSDKTYKYEVGFLLIPTLSQDQVNSTVETIKEAITSRAGAILAEGAPQMRPLAYEMTKGTVGKKSKYKTAYFGWVQCSLSSAEALPFRADLEKILISYVFFSLERTERLYYSHLKILKQREAKKLKSLQKKLKLVQKQRLQLLHLKSSIRKSTI